jgi:hypothetical protein
MMVIIDYAQDYETPFAVVQTVYKKMLKHKKHRKD